MKKTFLLLTAFITVLTFTNCTDNSEEILNKEHERPEKKQYVDPKDDGKIKDTDPDETLS